MNYKLFSFVLITIFTTSHNSVIAQEVESTKEKALINILLTNQNQKPLSESVVFFSEKTGREYKGITNNEGLLKILIPVNDKYTIDVGEDMGYDKIVIPDQEFYQLNYQIIYKKEKETAFLKIDVHNQENKPLIEDVELLNTKTEEVYKVRTNRYGKASIDIPNNAHYIVNFANAPNYEEFTLPDVKNLEYHLNLTFEGSKTGKKYPTRDSALMKLIYIDFDNNAVPNEKVIIEGKHSGVKYEAITNKNGIAEKLVPIGDKYSFSVKHWSNFQSDSIPNKPDLYLTEVTLNYPSSKEIERRENIRNKKIAARDSRFFNSVGEDKDKFIENTKESLERNLLDIKDSIMKNPKYFEKNNLNVSAVLYRLRNIWKKKLIVTDVTCSMHPYVFQLMQWHILKLNADEQNQYIFFNDGDGISNNKKQIGKTGGFHYSNTDNLDSLLSSLYNARKHGCSGDSPENDLEALLEAKKYLNKRWEVILIADNYSSVRDISLLEQLDVPIHIILCGLGVSAHEDYLNIAYKTGGSIHTIEEDIEYLSKVNEGETIHILGNKYYFTKGKFVLIK